MLPEIEPYDHQGGQVGVLLCHGFTASPATMRPWAEYLAAAGLTVSVPLLPGHGTRWQDLDRTRWPDWYATAERALLRLRERCDRVVVMGLSMGGTLALSLAIRRSADVAALVLVNPALSSHDRRIVLLPVLQYVLPAQSSIGSDIKKPDAVEWSYDRTPLKALNSLVRAWTRVRADLGAITQPLLVFRSREDHVVPASATGMVLDGISSTDVAERILEDSYHVAPLDNDAPAIFAESLAFVRRVTGAEGASALPSPQEDQPA